MIESPNALYLTLLNPLERSGFQSALSGLSVAGEGSRYGDEKLRMGLVMLHAAGVLRISHINDEPKESWGVVLGHSRRPDGDTLDQYLNQLIDLDEEGAGEEGVEERLGCIRPDGIIAQAQQASLRSWAEAGLFRDQVWRFDGHTVEYYGQAKIGKTKHGTKEKSVPAIDRYTLYNGIGALTDYFPTSISYDEALRQMVEKVNQALPEDQRILKLCFDKEGWRTETLLWLSQEKGIVVTVWMKKTAANLEVLAQIPNNAFDPVGSEMTLGKGSKCQILYIADTRVSLPHLGDSRVIVLETHDLQRIGIYTSAPSPAETAMDDNRCMSTEQVLEALRLQQHIENSFKVDVRQMGTDAIPTHKTLTVHQTVPYDLENAQKQLANAHKRLDKYTVRLDEIIPQLQDDERLDAHDINQVAKRHQRLQQKAQRQIETLTHECETLHVDDQGSTTSLLTRQVLDLRKFTLITLFKTHALVALNLLATLLGLDGAGPQRLRREFLAHGHRVEFDHQRLIATVYAQPFPRAPIQHAYEQLCGRLFDVPTTITRHGLPYQLRFRWDENATKQ